jgi:uncharacterized membrane protein YbhN (UPF0104 family)
MKKFFEKLLSGNSDTSSKRFASLISLFALIIITFIATFAADKRVTPEFMFDSLALIAGGGLGLTVIEKIFTKKTNPTTNEEPPQDPTINPQ